MMYILFILDEADFEQKLRVDDGRCMSTMHEPHQYFGLSPDVLKTLQTLAECYKSRIYVTIWNEILNNMQQKQPSHKPMEDIVNTIWPQAWDRFTNIVKNLGTGTIGLYEVQTLFCKFYRSTTDVKKELQVMCNVTKQGWNIVDRRVKQVEKFVEVQTCLQSSDAILRVRDTMELSGDFRSLSGSEDLVSRVNVVYIRCKY